MTDTETDRRPCPRCDASKTGCTTLLTLAGRNCCTSCTGTHTERKARA